jgi:hypothetical protein
MRVDRTTAAEPPRGEAKRPGLGDERASPPDLGTGPPSVLAQVSGQRSRPASPVRNIRARLRSTEKSTHELSSGGSASVCPSLTQKFNGRV